MALLPFSNALEYMLWPLTLSIVVIFLESTPIFLVDFLNLSKHYNTWLLSFVKLHFLASLKRRGSSNQRKKRFIVVSCVIGSNLRWLASIVKLRVGNLEWEVRGFFFLYIHHFLALHNHWYFLSMSSIFFLSKQECDQCVLVMQY